MKEEKNKNTKVTKEGTKEGTKVKKVRKLKKIKIGYILAFAIILVVAIMIIKLVLPSSTSKYGNRLDGIEDITFGDKEKKAITDKLKENEKVTEAKLDVKGKIIYVTYNIVKDCGLDEARAIGNDSLSVISDEVKNFYDMNYIITKTDEEGTTETKEDGTEVVNKEFPVMGYKNHKSGGIVW
ncbi:MAG: hypothetical protein IKF36_04545 [Bacilli bacterium]|nr:hypothetical protein [Bacilli bacterium]